MTSTRNRLSMATPFTDGQYFISPADFSVTTGAVTFSAGTSWPILNIPASTTVNLLAKAPLLLRTGQLATAAVNQEQFGTGSGPGPSSVAGTSGPLNLPPGFPPWTSSVNPTLTGGIGVKVGKGIQVLWEDIIYEIDSVAATSVSAGLVAVAFAANGTSAAPVGTNIIAYGTNGLPTTTNTAGQPITTRINVATPTFITTSDTEIVTQLNFVTPAGSSVKFYGAVIGVAFNFN